jgi:hypothetical protein
VDTRATGGHRLVILCLKNGGPGLRTPDKEETMENLHKLTREDQEAVINALENPPEPNDSLKTAHERYRRIVENDVPNPPGPGGHH